MSYRVVFCATVACWSLAPAAQLSIIGSAGSTPGSAVATIQLAGQGSLIAGVQFDLNSDPGLTVSAAIGEGASNAGKNLSTSVLSSGTRRFLIVGLNQNTIPDGVLLTLNIFFPRASGGTQYVLHASNAGATDMSGDAVSMSAEDGVIAVTQLAPTISEVVNGASLLPSIADGSWISIIGRNLAVTTRTWRPDEIVNGKLPTALDGIGVTVGGLPAPIYYISPTQLNVQAPVTGKTGPVPVIVTNAYGVSASGTANIRRNSPGIFVFAQGGNKYPAAVILRSDGGADYLGPSGLLGPGFTMRPARPGEVVELYATGLGPTEPAVAAGYVVFGAAPLVDPIVVTIGGIRAPVSFAGITSPGLYQINVTMPDLPSGEQPLLINVNGALSQPGVYVTTGQ
jgi:uncharacterized protein (TIGR03437 family)